MPIKVVDAEFKNKLKSLIAESEYSITDIDTCVMCAKPINLQDHESYILDFENKDWCVGCTMVNVAEKGIFKS